MKTKYEMICDEILVGELFEGEDALTYCKSGFNDSELELLDKKELINLIGKSIVVMAVDARKQTELVNEIKALSIILTLSKQEKIDILKRIEGIKTTGFIEGLKYAKRLNGKVNSRKSHKETNEIKKEIQDHFMLNKQIMFSGKKVEAYKYYQKLYPIAYDTIKKYLTNL